MTEAPKKPMYGGSTCLDRGRVFALKLFWFSIASAAVVLGRASVLCFVDGGFRRTWPFGPRRCLGRTPTIRARTDEEGEA